MIVDLEVIKKMVVLEEEAKKRLAMLIVWRWLSMIIGRRVSVLFWFDGITKARDFKIESIMQLGSVSRSSGRSGE